MFCLDHIVVAAESLDAGVRAVEAALDVPLSGGGQHVFMGTHNRLLSLGPDTYLEVIAIDPDLPSPDGPRWFGLDQFTGAPRLVSWVWAASDMAVWDQMPGTYVPPKPYERGDLRWQMSYPIDSPLGTFCPGLLAWQDARAQDRLPDIGVRLSTLQITHPEAALIPALDDARVQVAHGPAAMSAVFETPHGARSL